MNRIKLSKKEKERETEERERREKIETDKNVIFFSMNKFFNIYEHIFSSQAIDK